MKHKYLPIRLKDVNGAKTRRVVMRRTKVLVFHQYSPNHPSSIPAWWIPNSSFPANTSPSISTKKITDVTTRHLEA